MRPPQTSIQSHAPTMDIDIHHCYTLTMYSWWGWIWTAPVVHQKYRKIQLNLTVSAARSDATQIKMLMHLQIINMVRSVANMSGNKVMAFSLSFVWYCAIAAILCRTMQLQWFGKMLKIPRWSMPHSDRSVGNNKFRPESNWANRRKMIRSQRLTPAARDKPISIESIWGSHPEWMSQQPQWWQTKHKWGRQTDRKLKVNTQIFGLKSNGDYLTI